MTITDSSRTLSRMRVHLYLQNCECLNAARVRDVRSTAQIDQGTTAIHRRNGAIRDFGLDQLDLVLVVLDIVVCKYPMACCEKKREMLGGSKYKSKNETNLKHLQEILLTHFETDKGLLLFNRVLGARFQVFVVARRDKSTRGLEEEHLSHNGLKTKTCLFRTVSLPFVLHGHFVVEPVLDWRSNTEMAPIMLFTSFAQDVSRRMPKDGLAFFVLKVQKLELTRANQGTLQIPKDFVDLMFLGS